MPKMTWTIKGASSEETRDEIVKIIRQRADRVQSQSLTVSGVIRQGVIAGRLQELLELAQFVEELVIEP